MLPRLVQRHWPGLARYSALLALCTIACDEPQPPQPTGESLQYDIETVNHEDLPGGVLAIIRREGQTTVAVTGTAGPDGEPLSPDSLLSIASVSKVYTAVLIYQLEESGQLNTSDRLSDHLPGHPFDPDVTLDHLLAHRGGVPDYAQNPKYASDLLDDPHRRLTSQELIDYATFKPAEQPGQRFRYSNTEYTLLGLVFEAASGLSLADGLQRGIVEPLELTSTSFATPPRFPPELVSAWLNPENYGLDPGTELPLQPTTAPFSGCQADCGVLTTAPELLRFFDALFAGELLSPSTLSRMTRSEPDAPEQAYGTTVYRLGQRETPGYGHGGAGIGYTTLVVLEPQSGDASLFFANNDAFDLQAVWNLYGPKGL